MTVTLGGTSGIVFPDLSTLSPNAAKGILGWPEGGGLVVPPGVRTEGSLGVYINETLFPTAPANLVCDIITLDGTYAARPYTSGTVHIWVVGAGGSGGSCEIDNSGLTTGNGSSSGGGAGGMARSQLPMAQFTGSYTATIGVGGAGVISAGDHWINGNPGSATTFVGANVNMTGNGGGAGNGAESSTSGGDTSDSAGAVGGTATGGNVSNFTGGGSGRALVTADKNYGATGGGGVNFKTNGGNTSVDITNNATSVGGKASDDTALPTHLLAALSVNGYSMNDFDGSDGVRAANSESPTFGAGSGGASHGSRTSGQGGQGVIIVVYEL